MRNMITGYLGLYSSLNSVVTVEMLDHSPVVMESARQASGGTTWKCSGLLRRLVRRGAHKTGISDHGRPISSTCAHIFVIFTCGFGTIQLPSMASLLHCCRLEARCAVSSTDGEGSGEQ